MHDHDHRLNLLGRVSAELNRTATPHALIGAAAMAVHGVSRATRDLDLLATERSCLDGTRWAALQPAGVGVEVIKGDWSDPLAGVVRFAAPDERPVERCSRRRWCPRFRRSGMPLMALLLAVAGMATSWRAASEGSEFKNCTPTVKLT
jgi:hypothetical protein